MKINLNIPRDQDTWSDEVVNDINSRIVAFLTENFHLEEQEIRDIAQGWVERLTIELDPTHGMVNWPID
jgi:hypothetical protein